MNGCLEIRPRLSEGKDLLLNIVHFVLGILEDERSIQNK